MAEKIKCDCGITFEVEEGQTHCKYCGIKLSDIGKEKPAYLAKEDKATLGEKKKGRGCLIAIGLLVGFFILIGLIVSGGEEKKQVTEEKPKATPKTESIELNGKVNFDGAQFHITNLDKGDWVNCHFILNGKYYYPTKTSSWLPGQKIGVIEAGNTVSVGSANFTLLDGTRFNPFAIKPQSLSISCDNGFESWGW